MPGVLGPEVGPVAWHGERQCPGGQSQGLWLKSAKNSMTFPTLRACLNLTLTTLGLLRISFPLLV